MLTARKQAQAKDIVGLDMISEADVGDAPTWTPESVTSHKVIATV
jgi:hypothetical protein